MHFDHTAARLWKHLSREDRLAAAAAFWKEPPQEVAGPALAAIIQARRLRPQVARSLPEDERARALASVLDLGETVAASLLVALHLGHRRPLLTAFLDAVGLPHEEGILKEEGEPPPLTLETARTGLAALQAAHPSDQIRVYFNTLWLQDPERWRALEELPE